MLDPPSEDVTAHVIEMFAAGGDRPDHPDIAPALAYLGREQRPLGAWYGRWGVNHIYGTWCVVSALVALRNYEDDWDGEGAVAPAPENINRAIQYVLLLGSRLPAIPAPGAAPGVSGEVLLTWRQGADSLEVEICRPDRFEWMRMRPDGKAAHWVDGGELIGVWKFFANR